MLARSEIHEGSVEGHQDANGSWYAQSSPLSLLAFISEPTVAPFGDDDDDDDDEPWDPPESMEDVKSSKVLPRQGCRTRSVRKCSIHALHGIPGSHC